MSSVQLLHRWSCRPAPAGVVRSSARCRGHGHAARDPALCPPPPAADAYLPFAFAVLSWGPGLVALLIGIASAWLQQGLPLGACNLLARLCDATPMQAAPHC